MERSYRSDTDGMVIRPSGVWNSRAPFLEFQRHHRSINRTFHILVVAVNRLVGDARRAPSLTTAKKFFSVKTLSRDGNRSWSSYRKGFGRNSDGQWPTPDLSDVTSDLTLALADVTEYAVLRYSSMFETFTQCWAL